MAKKPNKDPKQSDNRSPSEGKAYKRKNLTQGPPKKPIVEEVTTGDIYILGEEGMERATVPGLIKVGVYPVLAATTPGVLHEPIPMDINVELPNFD